MNPQRKTSDSMVYKEIKNSDGYYACIDGYIYSSWVRGSNSYKKEGKRKKLKGGLNTKKKYYAVNILLDGKRITKMVHYLIAVTFLGERPSGYTISHINGNSRDNRLENLKYETYSDNLNRKIDHGTHDRAFNNSRACLSPEDVEKIFELRKNNTTHEKIAEILKVSRTTIGRVLNKKRYHNYEKSNLL